MFLVIGASGYCGGAVTRALVKRGAQVRALSRSEKSAAAARKNGAQHVVLGDVADNRALEAALEGVDGVFYISGAYAENETALGISTIDAAVKAGVPKFVYSSALHPIATKMVNHKAKLMVEQHLIETDLQFTILQPARFMHGIIYSLKGILEKNAYREPFSCDSKMSFVDYDDVAEAAAICLIQPGFGRATFELCAAGELTRCDMCHVLSDVLGRNIRSEQVAINDWLDDLPAGLITPYLRQGLEHMFSYYDEVGFRGGNSHTLRSIIGKEPASYKAFVARVVPSLLAQ